MSSKKTATNVQKAAVVESNAVEAPAPIETSKDFVTIASQLERFRKDGRTMMPESSALVILRSAVQSPYTEVTGTSMTQYSAIYNNEHQAPARPRARLSEL